MKKNDDRLRFTLRVPRDLFASISDKARKTGISSNALILKILWDWTEKKVCEIEKEE